MDERVDEPKDFPPSRPFSVAGEEDEAPAPADEPARDPSGSEPDVERR